MHKSSTLGKSRKGSRCGDRPEKRSTGIQRDTALAPHQIVIKESTISHSDMTDVEEEEKAIHFNRQTTARRRQASADADARTIISSKIDRVQAATVSISQARRNG